MNILKLTDSEIHLLISALEIAATQFEIDAANNSTLREQFTRQAVQARQLADKVENAPNDADDQRILEELTYINMERSKS